MAFTTIRLAVLFAITLLPSVSTAVVDRPLRVAVASCPPFVISDGDQHGGLLLFLWDRVAEEMGVVYETTEYPFGEVLGTLRADAEVRYDVGISCLTITPERERFVDFSHSFHDTYIGIAVRERGSLEAVVRLLSRPALLKGVLFVFGMAGLVGGVFFYLEHRINPKLYSMQSRAGRFLEAFIVGLLFVTRGPIRFYEFKTLTARTFSALLAVGSTLLIAAITAVLASAVTLEGLQSRVKGVQDLHKLRVGALEASTSSMFLDSQGVAHRTFPTLRDLIEELGGGGLDAVAADAPFLKWAIREGQKAGEYESVGVIPYEFEPQSYGFALPEDPDLEESVNRALLTVLRRPEWRQEVRRYLGE